MRQSHLILSNAVIIWAMQALGLLPQLMLVPYLIGRIGETGYGVYALVWSLLISIDQMEKSLQSGVVKYSASYLAQGRMDEVNKIISTSFIYSIFLGVIACTGALITGLFYNDHTGHISFSLFVIGIMLLFIIPITPFIAVIQSRQRYYVGSVADTVSKYVSLLIVIAWFSNIGPSVESLIIIMAVILFLSRFLQVPIAYRFLPGLINQPRLFNKGTFRVIGSFGIATVIASLCLALNSTGIRWLMNELASTSFVTHLVVMLMPSLFLSQVIGAMTITVMPAASAYDATGKHHMLRELLQRGARYTMIMILGLLLVATFIMEDMLRLWVGSNYVFLTLHALILLASSAFMQSTSVAHHMLKGMGQLNTVILIYFTGLVVVPVISIVTVLESWENAYLAVSIGLSSGYIVTGILQLISCGKVVNANLWKLFMQAYAQPLAVASVIGLVAYYIASIKDIDNVLLRMCISSLYMLIFFVGCYFFIATTGEREGIRNWAQLIRQKTFSLF